VIWAAGAWAQSDAARLLALHEKVMRAHRQSDVALLLEDEADEYLVANRGAITQPSLAQRRAQLGPYLERTTFEYYRDARTPSVSVSADGTLGWVMVQVEARGTQAGAGPQREPVAFTSAWIELYRKIDGRWWRVGNVSNFKP
jgi:hypothetical protein